MHMLPYIHSTLLTAVHQNAADAPHRNPLLRSLRASRKLIADYRQGEIFRMGEQGQPTPPTLLEASPMLTGLAEALEQVQVEQDADDAAKEEGASAAAGGEGGGGGGGGGGEAHAEWDGGERPHKGGRPRRRRRQSFAEEALRINERRRKSLVADLAVVGVAGVRRRRRYSDIQPISNWRPQAERELALIPGLFPEYD